MRPTVCEGNTIKRPFENFSGSEIDAAVKVANVLRPSANADRAYAEIEQIAASGGSTHSTPWQDLAALGFKGDSADYFGLDNSCIDRVIERRLGLPITLAVLLVAVAKARGIPAAGVNFPGHFLASVDGQLVDPFTMHPIERSDCSAWYRGKLTEQLFSEASPSQIALRMLGNVRGTLPEAEVSTALDLVDHQLDLASGSSEYTCRFLCDKAELWLRLGSPDMARQCFQEAEKFASGSELQSVITARLDALRSVSDTLH